MAIQIQGNTIITDTRDLQDVATFNGLTIGIAAPTVTSPADGATDQERTVTITSSDFFSGALNDTHQSTDWELATDSGFSSIVQSNLANTTNLTSWTTGNLTNNETYYVRVRHNGTLQGPGTYSNTSSFSTLLSFAPTGGLGSSYEGGYYAGIVNIGGGVCYYLIVAPNATGCARCQWKTTETAQPNTGSTCNGYDNTYNGLLNSFTPAGNWTATRTIAGYSDWYLPSSTELGTLYNTFASGCMSAGEGYCATAYWASTNAGPSNACVKFFNSNNFSLCSMRCTCDLRAVRRVPI